MIYEQIDYTIKNTHEGHCYCGVSGCESLKKIAYTYSSLLLQMRNWMDVGSQMRVKCSISQGSFPLLSVTAATHIFFSGVEIYQAWKKSLIPAVPWPFYIQTYMVPGEKKRKNLFSQYMSFCLTRNSYKHCDLLILEANSILGSPHSHQGKQAEPRPMCLDQDFFFSFITPQKSVSLESPLGKIFHYADRHFTVNMA